MVWVEKVELDVDYFEKILNNSGFADNINEVEKQQRNHYYELIRQLRKNNIKNIEVNKGDLQEYENEYKVTESIHNDYRELVLKAFKDHEKDLHNTIDRHIVGNKEGKSYISKNEVERMLDQHFKKVESLVERYDSKTKSRLSFSDSFNELKESMKKAATKFKETLIERVNKTKKNLNDKFENIKEAMNDKKIEAKDKVNDVKVSAKNKVNASVNKINDQIKKVSNRLDKFVEVESDSSNDRVSAEGKNENEVNGARVSNGKIEKLYENHRECFFDVLNLCEVDVEDEAKYLASRNVLLTLDLEDEQSLSDLEERLETEYHKDRLKEVSCELEM